MIFVFGSNEAGIHGAGAASYALKHKGAVWGWGFGLSGQSYAIPTKDHNINTLSLHTVGKYIHQFKTFASINPGLEFQITQIGCGLAGFTDSQIAPLFADAPSNCLFDSAWKPFLLTARFWGTF